MSETDFGTEDVNFIAVEGLTGMAPAALDVQILDLRIVAETFASKGVANTSVSWNWSILACVVANCVFAGVLVLAVLFGTERDDCEGSQSNNTEAKAKTVHGGSA